MIFSAVPSPLDGSPAQAVDWLAAIQQAGFVGLLIFLAGALAWGYLYTRKAVEIMHSGLVDGQREKDAAHKERVDSLIEQRDYYKVQGDLSRALVENLVESETILLRQISPVLTKFFGEATVERGDE